MADPSTPDGHSEGATPFRAPRRQEEPYFPAPRRREERSPYRRTARAPAPPPEPEKPQILVSRPDPPAPPPKPAAPPKPQPKKIPRISTLPALDTDGRSGRALLAQLVGRYPRTFGLAFIIAGMGAFTSAVLDDRSAVLAAGLFPGSALVHRPFYLQMNLGVAALGAWMCAWGIPMDEKTARPRDWWILGLFIIIVAAIAARGPVTGLILEVF